MSYCPKECTSYSVHGMGNARFAQLMKYPKDTVHYGKVIKKKKKLNWENKGGELKSDLVCSTFMHCIAR